jgi:hypothetical protein
MLKTLYKIALTSVLVLVITVNAEAQWKDYTGSLSGKIRVMINKEGTSTADKVILENNYFYIPIDTLKQGDSLSFADFLCKALIVKIFSYGNGRR